MKKLIIFCLLCTACAHSKANTPANEPQIDVTKKDGVPGWVCVEERQTGSMISRRVCRSKEELAANERAGQDQTELMMRRGNQQIKRQ